MLDAVCAGHLCLDLVPEFSGRPAAWNEIFCQGKLNDVGPLQFAAGGSVANTGLALIRMGFSTALMAKVGGDILGEITGKILADAGADPKYLSVEPGSGTSYSIVLAPQGYTPVYMHNGAGNSAFTIEDIDFDVVRDARIFHLGYLTLLKQLCIKGGHGLTDVLKKAKEAGATTSLDTAMPDRFSEGAGCDWERIFADCLPYTDIFCPSLEELLFMTDRSEYYRLMNMNADVLQNVDMDQVCAMGARMIGMGAKCVLIKCGYLGIYVKTAPRSDFQRADLGRGAPANPSEWAGRELFSAPYRVRDVKSRIGAGGVAIAGFLAGVLRGKDLRSSLELAVGAASTSVSSANAWGDLGSLEGLQNRIDSGWQKENINYTGRRLVYDPDTRLYGE